MQVYQPTMLAVLVQGLRQLALTTSGYKCLLSEPARASCRPTALLLLALSLWWGVSFLANLESLEKGDVSILDMPSASGIFLRKPGSSYFHGNRPRSGVNIGFLSSSYLLNCSVWTEAQKVRFHRPGLSYDASDLGCFFCWGAPFLRIFLGVFTTPNELEEILFSGILHLFGESWTF